MAQWQGTDGPSLCLQQEHLYVKGLRLREVGHCRVGQVNQTSNSEGEKAASGVSAPNLGDSSLFLCKGAGSVLGQATGPQG